MSVLFRPKIGCLANQIKMPCSMRATNKTKRICQPSGAACMAKTAVTQFCGDACAKA